MDTGPAPDPVDEGGASDDGLPDGTIDNGAVDDGAVVDGAVVDGAVVDGAVVDGAPDEGPPHGKDPLRFDKWRKRSATGAVMTGIAVGLREALEPRRQEAPFVIVASDEPGDQDGPIDLKFDPDSPADTVAIIRRPVGDTGPDAPPSST